MSYAGFLLVPLGHGGVIQPACASLGGLLLASFALHEPLPPRRIAGALAMVLGLIIIGIEALQTIGSHGLIGDLMYVAAGCSFAIFGMLLRRWRLEPMPAVAVTGILSLLGIPILLIAIGNPVDTGFRENLLQAVVQGVFAGAGAIYLFTRAVVLLGASRAAVFPSLVSPFTLLIGFLALGIVPSVYQLVGIGDRRRRLPTDPTGMRRPTPPCGSRGIRRCAPARAECFASNWRTTLAYNLRRVSRSRDRR